MSEQEWMTVVSTAWEENRKDLLRYVARLVVNPDVAQDLVQQTALRALSAAAGPSDSIELRKWLFRIASNLTIDELRRRGTWNEMALIDARRDAEGDPDFVAESLVLRGTQEMSAIAREHLAFCFSCTLRGLTPQRAAILLLVEVYGYKLKEAAAILTASEGQAKNWLQEARAELDERHAERCALISKRGVCYQCSELAEFFNGVAENPLKETDGTTAERVRILKDSNERDLTRWHRRLVDVIEKRSAKDSAAG